MLCSTCNQISMAILRRSGRALLRGSWEWARLESLICSRCGAVLPERDTAEPLLEKLTQLSRFGLAEGGSPLLGTKNRKR